MCFWLYTSGSTGKPKGAVHVHADLQLTADLYASAGAGPHRERRLLFGGETVLRLRPRQCHDVPAGGRRHHRAAAGRPTPDAVAELLRKHPVTVFFAVPTFYAAFLASPAAPRRPM